jgi:hypothetical protein
MSEIASYAAKFSTEDKLAELRREWTLRRRVYPKWVAAGKLTQAEATRQLELIEEIGIDYRRMLEAGQLA